MQKQAKQMMIVLALLVVFGAAYFGMRIYNGKQEETKRMEEEASKIFVSNVGQEDITAFSYQNESDTLEFVKESDTWVLQDDKEIALNQAEIASMLEEIASLEAQDTLENPEDLSEYGFDSPVNVITYTTADGSVTLTIGMENTITSQYYLAKGEDDTLYLVSDSFPSTFQKALADLEEASEDTEEVISEAETQSP